MKKIKTHVKYRIINSISGNEKIITETMLFNENVSSDAYMEEAKRLLYKKIANKFEVFYAKPHNQINHVYTFKNGYKIFMCREIEHLDLMNKDDLIASACINKYVDYENSLAYSWKVTDELCSSTSQFIDKDSCLTGMFFDDEREESKYVNAIKKRLGSKKLTCCDRCKFVENAYDVVIEELEKFIPPQSKRLIKHTETFVL